MAKRITVVISQGQSANPQKRKLEEDLVSALLFEPGVEVTVIPNLYDLAPDGTGMLCLQGIAGDMVIASWLYPRAAHWVLDRNQIRGHFGATLLKGADADDEDEDEDESAAEQSEEADDSRVAASRELPNRKIYHLDLRSAATIEPFVGEIRRIVKEASVETVDLLGFIGGSPRPDQLERYLSPAPGNVDVVAPTRVEESSARRWYPVIDYSRCTNCMECLDFCLFGVYGVDKVETILVEQPDNCRKGCPACSRVCPENAIIFPQHKTPAIAGSPDGNAGAFKIDLSKLFGAPDALQQAVVERDVELVAAGRDAVGASVGMPKRQSERSSAPKDELDSLIDQLDDLGL
jgi:NAD-dependent dihydropyrimidine dehydrogenase PreA subunit